MYQALLQKVASERGSLYQASLLKKKAKDTRKEELQEKRYEKQEQELLEAKRIKLNAREEEKARQRHLHSHSFPQVHCHPLAETTSLRMQGGLRSGQCDRCYGLRVPRNEFVFGFVANRSKFTCEECDWDICENCFVMENKSDEEKRRDRVERERKAAAKRREQEEERRVREEAERIRWDLSTRFKPTIVKPPVKHKQPTTTLKFTVWCSDGYDNDGWHSYEGEPQKEFDSSWSTKKEANNRAEYLFFWKNPWGIDPQDVDDENGDPVSEDHDGMNRWTVSPPDSTRWTVGVVPSTAYPHLENSSLRRHNHDDEHTHNSSYYNSLSIEC